MKKYFYISIAALMMILTACNSEEDLYLEGEQDFSSWDINDMPSWLEKAASKSFIQDGMELMLSSMSGYAMGYVATKIEYKDKIFVGVHTLCIDNRSSHHKSMTQDDDSGLYSNKIWGNCHVFTPDGTDISGTSLAQNVISKGQQVSILLDGKDINPFNQGSIPKNYLPMISKIFECKNDGDNPAYYEIDAIDAYWWNYPYYDYEDYAGGSDLIDEVGIYEYLVIERIRKPFDSMEEVTQILEYYHLENGEYEKCKKSDFISLMENYRLNMISDEIGVSTDGGDDPFEIIYHFSGSNYFVF